MEIHDRPCLEGTCHIEKENHRCFQMRFDFSGNQPLLPDTVSHMAKRKKKGEDRKVDNVIAIKETKNVLITAGDCRNY